MKYKNWIEKRGKMISLIERMDKHLTLTEAEQYQISSQDELMEFLWLKPNVTHLNVDIFVDDGMSYKRNNHTLLLFVRNGYDRNINTFIPISICNKPCVLDDQMDFNITYDDIFDIQDFIQNNLYELIALSDQKISQEQFINVLKYPVSQVAESKEILSEMATLRRCDSNLPVDIWLDEGATYQGHAPRIKFRASNEQRTTREYSSMLLVNPPTIENLPKNCPIRKKDIDKIKMFVINNLEMLLKLAKGEIDYITEFKPNMKLD